MAVDAKLMYQILNSIFQSLIIQLAHSEPFLQENADKTFILIIGADNLSIIEKWHKWKELLEEYEIWVYPRDGFDLQSLCDKYKVTPIDAPMINISSTHIREEESSGHDRSAYRV